MNATELRVDLADVYIKLRSGKMQAKDAAELSNVAGKMIASAKVQLEYAKERKEKPQIAFLKNDD